MPQQETRQADVRLLNESEAADRLGMSTGWLRTRRRLGLTPLAIRCGRAIRYSPAEIERFIVAQTTEAAA